MRRDFWTGVIVYMRENVADESLSPELRRECQEWLDRVLPSGISEP